MRVFTINDLLSYSKVYFIFSALSPPRIRKSTISVLMHSNLFRKENNWRGRYSNRDKRLVVTIPAISYQVSVSPWQLLDGDTVVRPTLYSCKYLSGQGCKSLGKDCGLDTGHISIITTLSSCWLLMHLKDLSLCSSFTLLSSLRLRAYI